MNEENKKYLMCLELKEENMKLQPKVGGYDKGIIW